MKGISEYLKLIPRAIKDADNIIEGVINNIKLQYGTLDEDEREEITRRRIICAVCPFNSSNAVTNPLMKYKTDRFDEHCIFCKCNIDLKTASLDEDCGIKEYNEDHPESPMKLKWENYKKPKNEQQ